jgi:predicted Fe-Mo cluster-binding NifX family protein
MKIAIAYHQHRISPVFDVATRMLLVEIEAGREVWRKNRMIFQSDALDRARYLYRLGVEILICGAISWRLENALSSLGIQVIACTCGPLEEVIRAFLNQKLFAEGTFKMPGCLGRRHHRTQTKEGAMEKPNMNYETLIRITKAIPTIQDPEEIVLITVEGVTHALKIKGCSLFLFSEKSDELKLAGYYGLSDEYVNKGPVSAIRSIATSLQERKPVAIYDVTDDPRIQYAEAAVKEGIASILSTPIIIGERLLGCLRVYTDQLWEFTLNDVNFIQAVSQVVGMALEMCRVNKGLEDSIDIMRLMEVPEVL